MLPEIWGATDICHFGPCFTLLPNYWPWKLKFGQNGKKTLEILSFLHLCTINENHMMYGSWDVVAQRTEFFVILGHFLPFDPHLTTRKIKILKNENKSLEILSFHTRVPQITIIWCMVPEIWSAKDRIFSHFRPIFALKTPEDIIILHKSTKNRDHILYSSWDMAREGCNCYLLSPNSPN